LPYFWLQRRTTFKRTVETAVPTRAAAMDALRSCASLRWFCLAVHTNTACFTLFTALLPWYLEIGLRFANDELESAVQRIGMGLLICILALFPLLVWLVRRFGSDRVLLVGSAAGFVLHFSCHWIVYWAVPSGENDEERRKYNRMQNYLMVGLCGIAYSAVSVSWRLFEKEHFNFCVDDDQIIRAEIAQRACAEADPPLGGTACSALSR